MARFTEEWIGRDDNTPIPPRVKVRVWTAADGRCESCTRKIRPGEVWECDHTTALVRWTGEGHGNRESNLQCLCSWCHKQKTKADVADKSAAYSKKVRPIGIKTRKGRPLPGTKASGWKIPFNRPPERRT